MKMIRKLLSVVLALAMLLSIAGMALAQTADGTYEGVAQGMGGDVKVSVTVSGGVITDVTVLSQNETVGISDPALKSIPAAIVEANSTEVDAAAGATVTSEAIKTAVQNALDGVQEEEAAEVVVPFDHIDVIVVGGGLGWPCGDSPRFRAGCQCAADRADVQTGAAGRSGFRGSLVGVNTRIEAENSIEDSVELMLEDFDRLGGKGMNNPTLAKTFAENCGRAVDWLDTVVGVISASACRRMAAMWR